MIHDLIRCNKLNSICWLLEEEWWLARRIRTHFYGMSSVVTPNAIDASHWKFLITASNWDEDLLHRKRCFYTLIMRMTQS